MKPFIVENIPIQEKLQSIQPPSLKGLNRDQLSTYFKNTWELYELLFSSIKNDASFYLSPDPLRNPLIFYFGHTAAFYVNKAVISGSIEKGVNPYFEDIFAKGVDPELPKDLDITDIWPSLEEVKSYRKQVYDLVIDLIACMEIPEQITSNHQSWALLMAIEHDRIHFETSSVLIRQLQVHLVKKPVNWNYAPSLDYESFNPMIYIGSNSVQLGKNEPCHLYGWDNEFGNRQVEVKPFFASKNLISNGDFLSFVDSGAYNDPKFWTPEGLDWKKRTKTNHPKFWVLNEGKTFTYRAMFDVIEMPLDWPVEVNKLEALAYIKYLDDDFRLLSEIEFQLICKNEFVNKEPFEQQDLNLNLQFGSPSPVGYFSNDENRISDLFGNVWDWLDDDFNALPGFGAHPWYKDFSEPYFDDQHSMLMGGCWATTGTAISKYYRLWFRDYFYQHAGFRLAKNVA